MNFNEYYLYDESVESNLIHKEDRHKVVAGTPVRASNGPNGYKVVKLLGRTYRAHRVIWEMHNGPIPEGLEVDHIDRDKANNRLSNLRLASKSQNSFNRAGRDGKGLPKGIGYLKKDKTFQARIMSQGKRYCFHNTDMKKCLEWLEETRSKLHGEFGCN